VTDERPALTVVIPTIGRLSLQRAIDSVFAQTVPCDLVVEHDPDRTGCGPTLNRAIQRVQTVWMTGCGDDDALLPTLAERLAEQDQDLAMVIFQMRFVNGRPPSSAKGTNILPLVTEVDELECGNVGSTFAIKTEVAREIGYMTIPCAGSGKAEDWEMIAAVRDRGLPIKIVPEVMFLAGMP
jgi:hypothetical protein